MEPFVIILLLAILVILLNISRKINRRLKIIHRQIIDLERDMNFKLDRIKAWAFDEPTPDLSEKKKDLDEPVDVDLANVQKTEMEEEEREEFLTKKYKEIKAEPTFVFETPDNKFQRVEEARKAAKRQFQLFKNIDFEKLVGENLFGKIGIIILVLGLGFSVKYAIDNQWINEIGRVGIGLLSGAVLLGIAHYLRVKYLTFSSLLIGGGLSILYITITLAYQDYQLIPQTPAFLVMVLITTFSVLLSVLYDRKELAVFSILGGFASPLLASDGSGNYLILFSYISILNVGMLTLAYFKKWNIVNIVSYIATVLLFGAWLGEEFLRSETVPYYGAITFATVFYLIFFFMNIIHNLKENQKFAWVEISLLLSNTFLYYLAAMFILHEMNSQFDGLFTAILAIFNFAFAYMLYKNDKVDKNFVYLLIGLVLTFISLVAPVQLDGNYITIFWAAETVLLLWLGQNSGIKIIKTAAVLVNILMIISLLLDWENLYNQGFEGENTLPIFFNHALITSLFAIVSLSLSAILLHTEKEPLVYNWLPAKIYRHVLLFITPLIIYFAFALEINYQLNQYLPYIARSSSYSVYHYLYVLVSLIVIGRWEMPRFPHQLVQLVALISIFVYLTNFVFDYSRLRDTYLINAEATLGQYLAHYLAVIFLIPTTILLYRSIRKEKFFTKKIHKISLWFVVFTFLFIGSAELVSAYVLTVYDGQNYTAVLIDNAQRLVFPIWWGLSSFILLFAGLKTQHKDLRIIALSVFVLTIVKLFAYDVWNMSEGTRIAAFVSLGVLLLIGSFLYQKLKTLIFEDE